MGGKPRREGRVCIRLIRFTVQQKPSQCCEETMLLFLVAKSSLTLSMSAEDERFPWGFTGEAFLMCRESRSRTDFFLI